MPALAAADAIERRVLIAIELADSVTGQPVSRRMRVDLLDAAGRRINGPPIISLSGRYVWLIGSGNEWPAQVKVVPSAAPYIRSTENVPPPAADPQGDLPWQDRRVRILLRPTHAYRFDAGLTAVRGSVVERLEDNPPVPVAGALVQLAYLDGARWSVGAPPAGHRPNPGEAETDASGQFVVFAHTPPSPPADPDLQDGLLLVRLQVTRNDGARETRATANDFQFAPGLSPGRIPEGRLTPADVKLGWTELAPL